ncbi:Nuclear factor NF-kappa-B p105 subunit [Phlyctochytrium bullatum]|nr:Nuclear factor NF-kappa-B p105 subunit [Phlyctochytrium bullatum]
MPSPIDSSADTLPTFFHPSFPIDLAAANHLLRLTVPAAIDYTFAACHLAAIGFRANKPGGIRFNHPVLFMFAAAAIAMRGVSMDTCLRVWGMRWIPQELEDDEDEAELGDEEVLISTRVRALRAVVRYASWSTRDTELCRQLSQAFIVAGAIRSLELLDDLRSRFPDAVTEDGLKLIPRNHSVLGVRNNDYNGYTLLEGASLHSNCEVIQVLLDLGADVNPQDSPVDPDDDFDYFGPPLWCAMSNTSDLATVKLLLANGARIDRHDLMRLLLAFGADPTAPDDVPELFQLSGVKLTMLEFAVYRNDPVCSVAEVVEVLIRHGADVVHPSHRPPLLHVTLSSRFRSEPPERLEPRGIKEIVRMLLQHEAPVDGVDEDGRTPLHVAQANGYKEAAVVLLEAGADPARRDGGATDGVPECAHDHSRSH